MKIIATNLGKPTSFRWKGKMEQTGIFKYPSQNKLFLGNTDVENDTVIDRRHHGGIDKACYLFSADYYPYWKKMYPELTWDWGMFGENLTVEGLNEANVYVGSIYKIGGALVQISQPREPCYKLGIRFRNQAIIKQFVLHNHPGTYVKIIEKGEVKTGDTMRLVTQSKNKITVQQFYKLIYAQEKNQDLLQLCIANPAVPAYKKEQLKKFLI